METPWIRKLLTVVLLVLSAQMLRVPGQLSVQQIQPAADHLTIRAELTNPEAACPDCGTPSRRVHSRRLRVLGDLPWQGCPVRLHVSTRRFHCGCAACPRRTFAERLAGVARTYARRTERVCALHQCIGLAVGGEAGARLVERLAMPVSADTLLRAACARADDAKPPPVPRVLGVDDWAWRRGRRYGTILVDLERNRPIALLPDRTADTLASWLKQHPGVEIIARDRAGAYAAGARDGAPDAVQVADRWHVLRNLGDAVRSAVERCHAVAKRVAREIAGNADPAATREIAAVPEPTVTAPDHVAHANSRRQSLFGEASRLHAAGTSIVRISRVLGVDRKTLRRWLRAGALPTWRQPRRARMIDAHLAFLERRWAEGCRNASLLWRELVHAGFRGRYTTVKNWAARRRDAEAGANAMQPGRQTRWEPPSSRRTTRLLMAESDAVDPIDGRFIARLLETSPDLASTVAAAKRLAALLRRKGDEALVDVLAGADATMIRSFVVELRKDIDAVQASLKLPWTTSPVEGQVSRLKMLKRTMYVSASFRLLSARVLHAER